MYTGNNRMIKLNNWFKTIHLILKVNSTNK